MSNQERDEYMKTVKWKTALYVAVSAGSILLAIAGIYWGIKIDLGAIKSDMVSNQKDSRNELILAETHIKIYVDSNFRERDKRLDAIENKLSPVRYGYKQRWMTQHIDPVTGKRTMVSEAN